MRFIKKIIKNRTFYNYGHIKTQLHLYGLEACPLNKSQLNSLAVVINWFFMKLFATLDRNIVVNCQEKFGFMLPSTQLEKKEKV